MPSLLLCDEPTAIFLSGGASSTVAPVEIPNKSLDPMRISSPFSLNKSAHGIGLCIELTTVAHDVP